MIALAGAIGTVSEPLSINRTSSRALYSQSFSSRVSSSVLEEPSKTAVPWELCRSSAVLPITADERAPFPLTGPPRYRLGYTFVGILVVGVVLSIAELRYVGDAAQTRFWLRRRSSHTQAPPVPSYPSAEPSSDTQNTLSTRRCHSPRDGTPYTATSSRCRPS